MVDSYIVVFDSYVHFALRVSAVKSIHESGCYLGLGIHINTNCKLSIKSPYTKLPHPLWSKNSLRPTPPRLRHLPLPLFAHTKTTNTDSESFPLKCVWNRKG